MSGWSLKSRRRIYNSKIYKIFLLCLFVICYLDCTHFISRGRFYSGLAEFNWPKSKSRPGPLRAGNIWSWTALFQFSLFHISIVRCELFFICQFFLCIAESTCCCPALSEQMNNRELFNKFLCCFKLSKLLLNISPPKRKLFVAWTVLYLYKWYPSTPLVQSTTFCFWLAESYEAHSPLFSLMMTVTRCVAQCDTHNMSQSAPGTIIPPQWNNILSP